MASDFINKLMVLKYMEYLLLNFYQCVIIMSFEFRELVISSVSLVDTNFSLMEGND